LVNKHLIDLSYLLGADDIILPALESGEGTSAAAICRDLGSSSHRVKKYLL